MAIYVVYSLSSFREVESTHQGDVEIFTDPSKPPFIPFEVEAFSGKGLEDYMVGPLKSLGYEQEYLESQIVGYPATLGLSQTQYELDENGDKVPVTRQSGFPGYIKFEIGGQVFYHPNTITEIDSDEIKEKYKVGSFIESYDTSKISSERYRPT